MNVRSASLLIVVFLFPVAAFCQEGQRNTPSDPKPIDWFYEDANRDSKKLLLKLLQFTAPYPGYYTEIFVDTDGNAFSARIVPDWAVQSSVNAKLDEALLVQIRQMLAHLSVPSSTSIDLQLQGQLHTAFVFYDGHELKRLVYNGPNPSQIDEVLQVLHKQFAATVKRREEEFAAHETFVKEAYGDWQKRAGLTLNAGSRMHGCKGNRALILVMSGKRKTDRATSPALVSVYHALVFYPGGSVSGSGSGGRWGDDPVQSNVVIWTVPNANGSFSRNTSDRKLEILNNEIDGTITIVGKTYHLNGGNMFIIRFGEDWSLTVTQLNDTFEEQATPQASLNQFKAIFKQDASIQALELY